MSNRFDRFEQLHSIAQKWVWCQILCIERLRAYCYDDGVLDCVYTCMHAYAGTYVHVYAGAGIAMDLLVGGLPLEQYLSLKILYIVGTIVVFYDESTNCICHIKCQQFFCKTYKALSSLYPVSWWIQPSLNRMRMSDKETDIHPIPVGMQIIDSWALNRRQISINFIKFL